MVGGVADLGDEEREVDQGPALRHAVDNTVDGDRLDVERAPGRADAEPRDSSDIPAGDPGNTNGFSSRVRSR